MAKRRDSVRGLGRWFLVVGGLVTGGVACGAENGSSAQPQGGAMQGAPLPSGLDLGAVVDRVHFAFARAGDHFVTSHPTHRIRVGGGGRVDLTATAGPTTAAGLSLETISASCGVVLAFEEPRVTVGSTGVLEVRRGALTEVLENHAGGLDQRWHFAAAAPCREDLVVRVSVRGQRHVGRTESGHHFRDEVSGLGFRYGAATWVDARGRRTPLDVEWTGAELAISVPAATLRASQYPAILDPTISPEYAVDAALVAPASGPQGRVEIAASATQYLAVWEDARGPVGMDVYGARVAADGTVLDPSGIPIATGVHGESRPVVTATDAGWLVAWVDSRAIATDFEDVYAARVDPSGIVLDPGGFLVAGGAEIQSQVALARVGSVVLAAWVHGNYSLTGSSDIHATRISPSGALLDPAPIVVNADAGVQTDLSLTASSTAFLAVWAHGVSTEDVRAARVTPAGAVLDGNPIRVSSATGQQRTPAVASDGTDFLAVWDDGRSFVDSDVYAARITASGTVPGGANSSFLIAGGATNETSPAVAYDGARYVVTWADGGTMNVYGARVSTTGTVLDPAGVTVSGAPLQQSYPALACVPPGCFAAWSDHRWSDPDVYSTRLTPTSASLGVVSPAGVALATAANAQRAPAVAFDGVRHLVVWEDHRKPGDVDIRGVLVDAAGVPLDPAGISIAAAPRDQREPAVAYGAGTFLVAYSDHRITGTPAESDVYAVRVSPAGVVSSEIALGVEPQSETQPAVASSGTQFLVAWAAPYPSAPGLSAERQIRATRVLPTGAILDAPWLLVSDAISGRRTPAVASDGIDFLVAWIDRRVDTAGDVWAAGVTGTGIVQDPTGVAVRQAPLGQASVAAVHDGRTWVVAWTDPLGIDPSVLGMRVGADRSLLDPSPFPVSSAVGSESDSTLAATSYGTVLAAWTDRRAGTTGDVYAAEIVDGVVLDPAGFGVATSADAEVAPAVAVGPGGSMAIAYERLDLSPSYRSWRARFRHVAAANPLGAVCATDGDCVSRLCVDGYCCDAACNGACESCDAVPGSCMAVVAAVDPDTCAGDFACDAASRCRLADGRPCANGIDCASGACVDGFCCNDACSGGCDTCSITPGVCTLLAPGSVSAACGAYLCGGGASCPTSCDSDAACGFGAFCSSSGTCEPRRGRGQTCDLVADCRQPGCAECATGLCVDGYCCESACDGPCDVCSVVPGTCTLLGAGLPGVPSCAPFACDGSRSECPTVCASDAACAPGSWCDGGTCRVLGARGAECLVPAECASGFCVDGRCCDGACSGQCEACDVEGAEGTCAPVVGSPRGARAPCPAVDAGNPCSQTSCDGNARADCAAYVGPSVVCRVASCSDGIATFAAGCDGRGGCEEQQTKRCEPYVCAGAVCVDSCEADADCSAGNRCDRGTGRCLAGAVCTDDFTLQEATGETSSCRPYRCSGGTCRDVCSSSSDCADGWVCDRDTCVSSTAPAAEADGGCGCRVPSGPAVPGWKAIAVLLLVVRRRRRTRGSPPRRRPIR